MSLINNLENVATEARHVASKTGENMVDSAKVQAKRGETWIHSLATALPDLSNRLINVVLDQMELTRKPTATSSLFFFANGVALGAAATALLTPVTGSDLRKKIFTGVTQWASTMGARGKSTSKDEHVENEAEKNAKATLGEAKDTVESSLRKSGATDFTGGKNPPRIPQTSHS